MTNYNLADFEQGINTDPSRKEGGNCTQETWDKVHETVRHFLGKEGKLTTVKLKVFIEKNNGAARIVYTDSISQGMSELNQKERERERERESKPIG